MPTPAVYERLSATLDEIDRELGIANDDRDRAALIRELMARTFWLLIEVIAPEIKDRGTVIWLACPGTMRLGFWNENRWADWSRFYDEEGTIARSRAKPWRTDLQFEPTHYQLCPEPLP